MICLFAAAMIVPAGLLRADQISLNGDARLSGTVRSITAEGIVELESPLSPERILLRGEAVRKVTFTDESTSTKIPPSRIELNNGDVIPVEVESLDEERIHVVSPVAGKLEIPRSALKSLMLGIHPNRVIYSGPRSPNDLKPDGPQADNWSYDEGVVTVQGGGRALKRLEPVKQFIVRFTLQWDNNPSFQFFFADPLLPPHQIADRYYFQLNGSGIELKRESSTAGKRHTSFATLNRRPDQFAGNQVKVEIRVDRQDGVLQLFLNDQPEGRFKDPVGNSPEGGGIAFVSSAGNDTQLTISDIAVLEWDPQGDRFRTEDRGDTRTDSMIERRGDRFSGKLISVKPVEGERAYVFKSDFQEEAIELPESEISTVFFKEPEQDTPRELHPFALRLRGDGVIRVSACSFPGDKIEATHPLLGPLVFSREGVTALERVDAKGGQP